MTLNRTSRSYRPTCRREPFSQVCAARVSAAPTMRSNSAFGRMCGNASIVCISDVLPGDHEALQVVEQDGAGEADDGDDEQTHIHLLDLEDLPARPDEVADTTLGRHLLGGNDHQERHTHAELDAGYDQR